MNSDDNQPGLGLYEDMGYFPYEVLDLSHMPHPKENKPVNEGGWITLTLSREIQFASMGSYEVNEDGWKCTALAYGPKEKLWIAHLVKEWFEHDPDAKAIGQNKMVFKMERRAVKVYSYDAEWVAKDRKIREMNDGASPTVIRDIRIPLWAKVWENPGYIDTIEDAFMIRMANWNIMFTPQPNRNGRIYTEEMFNAPSHLGIDYAGEFEHPAPVTAEVRANLDHWGNQLAQAMHIPANMMSELTRENDNGNQ